MKRSSLPLSLFFLALWGFHQPVALAEYEAHVPGYAHVKSPHCTCDCDNRLIFSQANVTYTNLAKWAQEAAIASYSYGFGNYETALTKASQYYTPEGWDKFSAALTDSQNLQIILAKKLLVKAIPTGEPKIELVSKGNEAKRWRINMPVVVKYENSQRTTQDNMTIIMDVVHNDPTAGVQGLGIASFIAKPTV